MMTIDDDNDDVEGINYVSKCVDNNVRGCRF